MAVASCCPCKGAMLSSRSLTRPECQQLLAKKVVFPVRSSSPRGLVTVAYMEGPSNTNLVTKILTSLPIVGLVLRILSDEGGLGGDRVDFPEFYMRVEKKCPAEASEAFSRFAERHGKVGKPSFVLVWCWAAAVGAGLLKAEDIAIAARRLRVSYDFQYEIDTLNLYMDEALEKRNKSNSPVPQVPMIIRIGKALDGICACCVGKKIISPEDADMLSKMLVAVFPGVPKEEIEALVASRLTDDSSAQPTKPAVKLQESTETTVDR